MEVTIRKVEEKDTARIADICGNGWRETVRGKLSETEQVNTVRHWYNHSKVKSDIKKGSYSYVALADNRVIGVIGGGMIDQKTGQVYVFYIDRKYRYRGIGKQLLDTLTDRQREKGAVSQKVSVQKDNELGLPFYKSHRFVTVEEKETKTGTGETQISLKMERNINGY